MGLNKDINKVYQSRAESLENKKAPNFIWDDLQEHLPQDEKKSRKGFAWWYYLLGGGMLFSIVIAYVLASPKADQGTINTTIEYKSTPVATDTLEETVTLNSDKTIDPVIIEPIETSAIKVDKEKVNTLSETPSIDKVSAVKKSKDTEKENVQEIELPVEEEKIEEGKTPLEEKREVIIPTELKEKPTTSNSSKKIIIRKKTTTIVHDTIYE